MSEPRIINCPACGEEYWSDERAEHQEICANAATHSTLGTVLSRSQLGDLPKIEPLIDGILSRPAGAVLVGSTGVGKTFLALSMACSIALGVPWLGHAVERTKVLYLLGEGAYGLDQRITAWETAWGHSVPDDDLLFAVQPDSLKKHSTWQKIAELAVDRGAGFVVLDTFSSLAPDADETKDAAMIMRWLGALATTISGTTLLVHHPGWSDNSRVRGGYQLEANADEVLLAQEVAKGSELFTLTRKKVKDGASGKTLYLRRKPTHGSCIIEQTTASVAGVPLAEQVVAVLSGYGDIGATGPQIMAELNIPDAQRSTFYRTLAKLQDAERVGARGPERGRRYHLIEGQDPS